MTEEDITNKQIKKSNNNYDSYHFMFVSKKKKYRLLFIIKMIYIFYIKIQL
jgi:hypothetical protein